ncbi:MAG: TonB-dependent receptor plug domain-containing protein [Polaribacter sp.]|nr:TonB-dependent receptor plug domain-containing protein [Polaribacter sp.]
MSVYSQNTGVLTGILTDKEAENQPLPFANVLIKGTTNGSTTDIDGKYSLNVPAGTHTVIFSFLGYKTVEKSFTIKAGQTITINQLMTAEEGVSLDEVQITTTTTKEKATALILDQKKSVTIETKIGAQELNTKGVSDAEGALTKISGVSKVSGTKNVFVRGLGDQYNSTSLNGLPLPSEDPEYKNISLDFFSTEIIQFIEVNKVFNAGIFGDVGGANINIVSKEMSQKKFLIFL